MPPFAKALFNAANGTIITAYTPEIGTLATHPVSASGVSVIRDGRLRASASLTDEIYFFSETPPDPNYPVISRQRYYSGVGLFRLYTRLSPLSLTAYVVEWYNGGYRLSRFRYPPDTTILTGVTYPLTSGTTNSVAIRAVNTDDGNVRVSVFVNGVRIINYLDDSADKITDTGHAGFQFYDTDAGDAAGFHLDSIQAGLGDDDVIGVTDTARKARMPTPYPFSKPRPHVRYNVGETAIEARTGGGMIEKMHVSNTSADTVVWFKAWDVLAANLDEEDEVAQRYDHPIPPGQTLLIEDLPLLHGFTHRLCGASGATDETAPASPGITHDWRDE